MEWYRRESLVRFQSPCRIMICGASMSGKTFLAKRILENANGMFSESPVKIILCYDTWQPMFDDLRKTLDITFHQGLPDEDQFSIWSSVDGHKLMLIDDCMAEGVESPDLMKMFCVKSHHANFSVLFLVQNVFQKGKIMRTLSLNTSYFILFRNYRDQSQIEALGRQIFPRQSSYFREAYRLATSNRFGYLVIDVSPIAPSADIVDYNAELPPLRAKILPGEDTIVYFPKQ